MMKERMMAIVIGGLMLFSVAGFALMGMGRFIDNGPVQVPNIMNEYLSGEQVSSILRSGRVLIRDVYTKNCSDCITRDITLEIFVNSFPGLVVLEEMMIEPDNATAVDGRGYVKFEMLSPTGEIIELDENNITQEGLTEMFCDISAVQPRECLLMDIATTKIPLEPDNATDTNMSADIDTDMNSSDITNATTDNDTINSA
jgi:hypothetical protein